MSCLAWQVGAAGMQQDRWGDCCISSRCLPPGSRKGAGAVGRQRSTHLSPQDTKKIKKRSTHLSPQDTKKLKKNAAPT